MNSTPYQNDTPPVPPSKPDPDACCHGGCALCVLDLYQDELEQYQLTFKAWQRRQPDCDA
ncbi:hypothetical protein AAKU55_005042 [Oxalobacteraceae bacterium GrIS 1.11]